jgi:hypothetical protein
MGRRRERKEEERVEKGRTYRLTDRQSCKKNIKLRKRRGGRGEKKEKGTGILEEKEKGDM